MGQNTLNARKGITTFIRPNVTRAAYWVRIHLMLARALQPERGESIVISDVGVRIHLMLARALQPRQQVAYPQNGVKVRIHLMLARALQPKVRYSRVRAHRAPVRIHLMLARALQPSTNAMAWDNCVTSEYT